MKAEIELKDLSFEEKSKMKEEYEEFCGNNKFKDSSFLVFIAYMETKYYFVSKLKTKGG